jgi:antitoxin Phd
MKAWSVQDAKARFSEFLETCLAQGPQMVTKRGADAAVLISAREWARLQQTAGPTLKELLLAERPRGALPIPQRGRLRRRRPAG